jgi:hypothetical protein
VWQLLGGCCSYQVSSISVGRVTCYDHCCAFQFFSILAISMATAAILKKSTLYSTTSHMKLCRNIHCSVWQLLGVVQIQNGGRCHGNQGAKMLNSLLTSQSFAVMFPVTSTSDIPTKFHEI